MFQRIKLIAALLVTVIAMTGCSRGASREEATPTPVPTPIVPTKPTYVVQRGEVVKTLEFSGRVSPVVEEELFFRTGGYVAHVYVTRNQEVKAGDILAELEITDLLNQLAQAQANLRATQMASERQVAEAEANLRTAELRLAQARAQDNDSQVTVAEVNLERARQALADAQEEYDKALSRTWEPDQVRESYARWLRDAELNLRVAEASYQAALQAREAHKYEIQILQLNVEQARRRLEEIQAGLDIEQARLTVQRLEAQVADARIVAPFDGVVLSLNLAEGRLVDAYRVVMSVADPTQLEVSVNLDQKQMADLVEGMAATAELTSRPGETIPATIRRLPYPYGRGGRTTRGTGTAVSQEDTSTRIKLDSGFRGEYKLGDLVRVTVVLERKADVLWLPPQAIRTFEGRKFVVVQEPGGAQRRVDVKIGIESEDRVEIEEGLTEGQVVVSP
jgi:RND family efflux transporter MFP subunit